MTRCYRPRSRPFPFLGPIELTTLDLSGVSSKWVYRTRTGPSRNNQSWRSVSRMCTGGTHRRGVAPPESHQSEDCVTDQRGSRSQGSLGPSVFVLVEKTGSESFNTVRQPTFTQRFQSTDISFSSVETYPSDNFLKFWQYHWYLLLLRNTSVLQMSKFSCKWTRSVTETHHSSCPSF